MRDFPMGKFWRRREYAFGEMGNCQKIQKKKNRCFGYRQCGEQESCLLAKWLCRFPLEQHSLWHNVIKSKYDIQTINGILRWSLMDPTAAPRSSSLWGILPLICIQDLRWKIENRFSFAKMSGLVLFLFVSCFLDCYID